LKEFYKDFATKDQRIKEFVEKITDFVVTQEYQPLHSFQISDDQNFAVLAFDTEMTNDSGESRHSYDLIVKDLSINRLMPVLILNTDGDVAFDKFNGFYYTQIDSEGGTRGAKVFRH
jgi:protease II